jgi:hypothetical protein
VVVRVEQLDGHRITRLLVRVAGDGSQLAARESSSSRDDASR